MYNFKTEQDLVKWLEWLSEQMTSGNCPVDAEISMEQAKELIEAYNLDIELVENLRQRRDAFCALNFHTWSACRVYYTGGVAMKYCTKCNISRAC